MAEEDDDDLYDEEFDFVDDDDDDEKDAGEEQASADDSDLADEASDMSDVDAERDGDREQAGGEPAELKEDEYGRTEPVANYVVHLYEAKKFNRTIDRPFTPEDAEAFATEFNRTGKNYGRMAVTGKNDAKPKKSLD